MRDEERAAVEDGVKEMAKLTSGLRYAAAPDGRTLEEIAAITGSASAAI